MHLLKNVNLIFKELICDYIANPAIAAICVQITSNAEEIGCIVVVDVTGKMMMGSTGNLRKGLNTINIELDALQSGV